LSARSYRQKLADKAVRAPFAIAVLFDLGQSLPSVLVRCLAHE
jgi:hypothetical protein